MANLLTLVSTEVLDSLGVVTTQDIFLEVPDTTTLATLTTQVQAYQALLDGITGSALKKTFARIEIPLAGGVKGSAVAGSANEETMLANFSQTGSTYKNGIDVPAVASQLIVNGKIDLSNAGLQAWITWLTSAHSGIQAVSKFVLTLVALVDALITFRKHRKAESRRSVVVP